MSPWDALSHLLGIGTGTAKVFLGLAAVLLVGLVKRGVAVRRKGAGPDDRRRWGSVLTWSVLFLLLVAAASLGRAAVAVGMAVLSLLLLREGLRLTDASGLYGVAAPVAAGFYLWAWLDGEGVFLLAAPLGGGVWLVVEAVERVRTGERVTRRAAVARSILLTVVGPSYVMAAASLPAPEGLPESEMGWMVLLVVVTELNDTAASWWGRSVGRRRLAPRISPAKTWAGLWGGLATTMAAAVVIAPLMTSWGRAVPPVEWAAGPPWAWSVLAGLLVGVAGTAGDLSASILKRRAGADDSGTALPGHGGWLDRFDSLAVSAPVYFLVTWILWFAGGGG